MAIKRTSKKTKPANKKKRILSFFIRLAIYFIAFSIAWVLILRFINPPITWLMIQRNLENSEVPEKVIKRKWIKYEDISTNLKLAAVASEDARFMQHSGFDTKAINQAFQKNQSGAPIRGGSTISQQTAKNVFLWPHRSWVRKGFEAWFTVLIEALWGKERILEVYLNVIEMGPGVYGAEAATQFYYNKSAVSLTKRQAALIAAILPNPRVWSPNNPTNFINRKTNTIIRYMSHSKIPE
jgi:monofunctional biosynthetic peptidoglycan transglycosylase